MAGRIDDLRKKLEKAPESRLFAQLAEELRKTGELDEAVEICRAGLEKHPNYPSARMTLGRALRTQGDLAGAREQFEMVVNGAPDNILASRLLGECLEELGESEAALDRYRLTLELAPGDEQLTQRIAALEAGPSAGKAAPGPEAAAAPALGAPPAVEAQPDSGASSAPEEPAASERAGQDGTAPDRVADEEPSAGEPDLPPLPLAAAEEDWEVERPFESQAVVAGLDDTVVDEAATLPKGTSPEQAAAADDADALRTGQEFELEAEEPGTPPAPAEPVPVADDALPAREAASGGEPATAVEEPVSPPSPPVRQAEDDGRTRPVPVVTAVPPAPSVPPPPSAPDPEAVAAPATPEPAEDELATVTLAELYLRQGHREKALETYRKVVARDPDNARARARLEELAAQPAPAAAPDEATAARRATIEATIGRLEAFLAVVRKGA